MPGYFIKADPIKAAAGRTGVMYKMLAFYRKAAATFFGLVMLTALVAYTGVERVFVSDALVPAHQSAIAWDLETFTDTQIGGSSSASVNESVYSLNYEYRLTDDVKYPYVSQIIAFADPGNAENPVDLTKYSTATFRVKCEPDNVLAFLLHSFDNKVTDPGDFLSYRVASSSFSCSRQWSNIEIDLNHLKVPKWWLQKFGIPVFDQDYRLDKVIALSLDASREGPVNKRAEVNISKLTLHQYDWSYAWVFLGLVLFVWGGYFRWLFRRYTSSLIDDVREKLNKDLPLIAYQQLSIEPHRDKEKSRILKFLATEYTNPDMSLDFAVAALGINRTKVNELLKNEFGMTFSAYLNKLRLVEAARLISQEGSANISEIARLVGYKNVSYFNRLFKQEYGCTPGTFKELYESEKRE